MARPALLRSDGTESRWFRPGELRCRCGGRHGTDCDGYPASAAPGLGFAPALIDLLDAIRDEFGPVAPTNGYRCPAHNAAVGGVPNSFHTQGKAADIVAREAPPAAVFAWVDAHDPVVAGAGHYASFVHVDVGGRVARKYAPAATWGPRLDRPVAPTAPADVLWERIRTAVPFLTIAGRDAGAIADAGVRRHVQDAIAQGLEALRGGHT